MARIAKDTDEQFIEVGYADKVVFTVQNHAQGPLDLRAT